MEETNFGALAPKRKEKIKEKLYIGSDESLKGDSFGGLVVAAVMVDDAGRDLLNAVGVRDSKRIQDIHIPLLAKRVREIAKYHATYSLFPEEYNDFSLTGLMNKYHHQSADDTIKALKKDVENMSDFEIVHVVDKFPGANVGDVLETKAESKYPEVAAASILAREAALNQMDELSKRIGFKIPLGSTHVQGALERLKREGHPPDKFVKVHFKNVQRVLQGN
jgi:ribonuclease HIII